MHKFNKILLSSFLCSAISLSLCTSKAWSVYKIKDAIEDAKSFNQSLKALEQDLEISKLSRSRANSGFFPIAELEASYGQSRNSLNGLQIADAKNTSVTAGIGVSYELFSGGRSVAQKKKADILINTANLNYNSELSKFLMRVVESYHEVIIARRVYEISLDQEKAMNERLDQIRTRFKAGDVAKTDVSAAKYKLASAVANRDRALGDKRIAEANFINVIGKEPPKDLVFAKIESMELPKDINELTSIVHSNNLEIKIAEGNINNSRSDVAINNSKLLPRITARASIQERDNSGGNMPGLNKANDYSLAMAVPLFNVNNYLDIKESKHRARKAESLFEDAQGNIDANIMSVWSENKTASAQIDAIKEAIVAASDAVSGAKQEYSAGTKTALELLELQQNLFDFQIRKEQYNKSLIMSAFKIKSLMGELHLFNFDNL